MITGGPRNFPNSTAVNPPQPELQHIPLALLVGDAADDWRALPPWHAMIASVQSAGESDPVTVIPLNDGSGKYRIGIGHCRVHAARTSGLDSIAAILCQSETEYLARMRSLLSNRRPIRINPIELALALHARLRHDPTLTQEQLARDIGLHPTVVSRVLHILHLPGDLLAAIGNSQFRISADVLGRIAGIDNRRWQEALIETLLEGRTEQSVRRRIAQLTGKASKRKFKAMFECRFSATVIIRSSFKHLTLQQRRAVWLDAMAQDEKFCELEEARALA